MISWEHVWEMILQFALRKRIRDHDQVERFLSVRHRYGELCRLLKNELDQETFDTPGYDWESWGRELRTSFEEAVPLGFLAHPILAHTMVFARRKGILLSRRRIEYVVAAFGPQTSRRLLREDYVGLPTLTDIKYLTSANRSHHASHLACYTVHTRREFWNSSSIAEWGGGYGNMARILRRMNPQATYTIVDLPEMLALQYIYLASVENEGAINLASPTGNLEIVPGKINLVPAGIALRQLPQLRSESFISTWALTESQREAQNAVFGCQFLGATHVLLASMINENNALAGISFDKAGIHRVAVPPLGSLGEGNEYWFR